MKKPNETTREFRYRMKYLYVTANTDREQKFYAAILSKIDFL